MIILFGFFYDFLYEEIFYLGFGRLDDYVGSKISSPGTHVSIF